MHRLVILLAVFAIIGGGTLAAPAAMAAPKGRGNSDAARTKDARVIPDRFIVVLRDDLVSASAADTADDLTGDLDLEVTAVYDTALTGFAAKVPPGKLAALRNDPRVAFVEPDRLLYATVDESVPVVNELVTGVDRIGADRVTEGQLPTQAGRAVAVLDTGIARHPDLNVKGGYNCTSRDRTAWGDVNGHGTHVAGTIGARNNGEGVVGVAPNTPLWAVKVLRDDGSGPWSSVICGLDWVAKNAATKRIKVVNMSLGGGGAARENATRCKSSPLHAAVCRVANKGVKIVVAAGNDAANTANYVPAKYAQVTSVSALSDTDGCRGRRGAPWTSPTSGNVYEDDRLALFSNWGGPVDVAAPGVNINSTVPAGHAQYDPDGDGYGTMSGTSMAAPHVAGAFALGWNGKTREVGPIPGDDFDTRDEGIVRLSPNTACDVVVAGGARTAAREAEAAVSGNQDDDARKADRKRADRPGVQSDDTRQTERKQANNRRNRDNQAERQAERRANRQAERQARDTRD